MVLVFTLSLTFVLIKSRLDGSFLFHKAANS